MKHLKLFESFNSKLVFYKIVEENIIESIMSEGIKPNKKGGTWVICKDNFDDWIKPNNIFGSMLQALLYFPSRRGSKCCLLSISIQPKNLKVRNVDLMLKDLKRWKDSIKQTQTLDDDFKVKEYLLLDKVDPSHIEIIHTFDVPKELSKFKMDPNSLKLFIFGKSNKLDKIGKISTIGLVGKIIWLKLKNMVS